MTTIRAILHQTNSADAAIEKLGELNIEGLDWRIFQPQEERERMMPGAPMGTFAATGSSGTAPVATPIMADVPEEAALEEAGIPDDEAEYYAESLDHGATIIVIETPDEHVQTIRKLLEAAGASRITT